MKVGELIDLLEPFRGRGDDVVIVDGDAWIYNVLGTHWDESAKVAVVEIKFCGLARN